MTAQDVEFQIEKMIPEMIDLEERGIFTSLELKQIIKKRRDFEYSIHRISPIKNDFVRYIQYEKSIEKLRKLRKKKFGLDKAEIGLTVSDHSIVQRIHQLYQKTLKIFKADIEMWMEYFEWCKSVKSTKALSKNFAKAIQLHPTKSVFWVLAAKWEWEENNSITAARVLLQRSIRINPHSQDLWIEYFKLEVLWVQKLIERRKILFSKDEAENEETEDNGVKIATLDVETKNSTEDPLSESQILKDSRHEGTHNLMSKELSDSHFNLLFELKIPRAIYKAAIRTFTGKHKTNDQDLLDLCLAFLDVYIAFGPNSREARNEIYQTLALEFVSADAKIHSIALKTVCERYLDGFDISTSSPFLSDPTFPPLLEKVCLEYQSQYNRLLDQKLLADLIPSCQSNLVATELVLHFVQFLSGLQVNVHEPNLKQYIALILDDTCKTAHKDKTGAVELYLVWLLNGNTIDDSTTTTRFKIADLGIERHSTSSMLWLEKIKLLQSGNDFEGIKSLYRRAIENVKANRQDHVIWNSFIDWTVAQDSAIVTVQEVKQLFMDCIVSLNQTYLDAASKTIPLIKKYLTWIYTTIKSLQDCRDVFKSLCNSNLIKAANQEYTTVLELLLSFELEAYHSDKSPQQNQLNRIQKLWSRIHEADSQNIELWIQHISFEMQVTGGKLIGGGGQAAAQTYWKACKVVQDRDLLDKKYQELKDQ